MNNFLADVKKISKASKLEDAFAAELKLYGIPDPIRQFRFHPSRKWALDFAWPDHKIAVEIHGGIFMKAGAGGHNRGAYMEKSFEKENAAQLLGWKVFIFGPKACHAKKRLTVASPACEFVWKLFHPRAVWECYKKTGQTPPAGNSCLQTPGTCESCPGWERDAS